MGWRGSSLRVDCRIGGGARRDKVALLVVVVVAVVAVISSRPPPEPVLPKVELPQRWQRTRVERSRDHRCAMVGEAAAAEGERVQPHLPDACT